MGEAVGEGGGRAARAEAAASAVYPSCTEADDEWADGVVDML
jgi:hypothetical protein